MMGKIELFILNMMLRRCEKYLANRLEARSAAIPERGKQGAK